jgi:flagellar hook-basal body complex protein FliE
MVTGISGSNNRFGFSPDFEMKGLQAAFSPKAQQTPEGGLPSASPHAVFEVGITNGTGPESNAGSAAQVSQHFGDTLKTEMEKLNTIQTHAQQMTEDYAAGKDVALHQVMIAMNRADMSLQLATQIRNRLVSAYQDVSRMQL